MAIMNWFKVNGYNVIYGSLRLDTPVEQLIFLKLLALASISRVPGTVCIAPGVPYPRDLLAATIGFTVDELDEAIKHHCQPEAGRIKLNSWDGVEIINWAKYQSKSYERTRRYRERKRTADQECNVSVTDCDADVTHRREGEENRREKESGRNPPIPLYSLRIRRPLQELCRKHKALFPHVDPDSLYRDLCIWAEKNPVRAVEVQNLQTHLLSCLQIEEEKQAAKAKVAEASKRREEGRMQAQSETFAVWEKEKISPGEARKLLKGRSKKLGGKR